MSKITILAVFALGLMLLLAGCAQNTGPNQNKSNSTYPVNITWPASGNLSKPGTIYAPQGVPPAQVVQVAYNSSEFRPVTFDPNRAVRTQSFGSNEDLLSFAKAYANCETPGAKAPGVLRKES